MAPTRFCRLNDEKVLTSLDVPLDARYFSFKAATTRFFFDGTTYLTKTEVKTYRFDEIQHSDWFKLVMWFEASNQSALFQR